MRSKLATLLLFMLAPMLRSQTAEDAGDVAGVWRLSMERPGWYPSPAGGLLILERSGDEWKGRVTFDVVLGGRTQDLHDLEIDSQGVRFRVQTADQLLLMRSRLEEGLMVGTCQWEKTGDFEWTAKRATTAAFENEESSVFPRALARDLAIETSALDEIIAKAEATGSDALIILKDGHLCCERYFGHARSPIEAMSATKSIVAIAVALAVQEGDLESFDVPVCRLFSEWDDPQHRGVTIRHLLTQTSGLEADRTTEKIYASPDFVHYALEGNIKDPPGTRFFYNNRATNLLAGVIECASASRLDQYLAGLLFEPLGIEDFTWSLDSAGNPHAMSGLQIHALDLARIGQFMLDEGVWEGTRVLEAEMVHELLKPTQIGGFASEPAYGSLWWLTPKWQRSFIDETLMETWKSAGAEPRFLSSVQMLVGRRFGDDRATSMTALSDAVVDSLIAAGHDQSREEARARYERNTRSRGLPMARMECGPVMSYVAQGYLGQWLVVVPEVRLVAVRQRRYRDDGSGDDFAEFESLVRALAGL